MNIEFARKEFQYYLDSFDRENDKIKLKIVHTEGVVRCAAEIARRMNLSEEDKYLAELIALLHDIGRFEQIRQFDSFEPTTMDHASYGVELLFGERKMIRKFVKDDTWDALLSSSAVKQLCSTDAIHAEQKFKDPFTFKPSHTLVLMTNSLPEIRDRDEGI